MKKNIRKFLFGAVAAGLTTVAGVSAAVAGNGAALPDSHVFKNVGHRSDMYPMFIETETRHVHVVDGSILPTQYSRCGYDRVGETAVYREGVHITETQLSFPDMSYIVLNQHVDNRDILVVKTPVDRFYHLFGIQKKSGKLVEKLCSFFDTGSRLVSGCVTKPNTELPLIGFEAHAKTAVAACRRDVPQWNLDWKANQELTGVKDSFADYPKPSQPEITAYKNNMRRNLQTLDANN